MPKMVSPQNVYDDPKLWLSVDHQFHDTLRKLMRNLFDGFEEKIADMHCLLCEGKEPYEVWNIETKRFEYVTGYIQHEGEPVSLLRTIAKEEAGIQHEVQRPANPHAKQL